MTHSMLMNALRLLLYLVGLIGFGAFNAAYLSLLERKQSAWMQLRRGPSEVGWWGLLQPVADGLKLMSKQILIPRDVERFGAVFGERGGALEHDDVRRCLAWQLLDLVRKMHARGYLHRACSGGSRWTRRSWT